MINSNLALHLIPDLPETDAIIPWLRRMEAQRWYTNYGPLVQELEQGLLALLQAANPQRNLSLTTLATGYHALELGLRVLDLPPHATVLLPAVTFPACPQAVHHAGFTPLLADIDATTWQLTPAIARKVASQQKIAAVMPVAMYGVPLDAEAWDAFTEETGIPVLIDAAAAFEVQKIPRHALVAHSLHATKPFGIGEGGVLVGCNAERIARARQLSNFGTEQRIAQSWGSNAKLSEFHAAVGLAQLTRWPMNKAKRAALLEQYQAALPHYSPPLEGGVRGGVLSTSADASYPKQPPHPASRGDGISIRFQPAIEQAVPALLMLDIAPHLAGDVAAILQAKGIATHQTYLPPLYRHPAFTGLDRVTITGEQTATCSNAETLARHLLGVPFHPFMEEGDVERVVESFILHLDQ